MEEIEEKLGKFVIILFQEYYKDGIGRDIWVIYPQNLNLDYEETERLMEYLGEAYHIIAQFHIDSGTELQIYECN